MKIRIKVEGKAALVRKLKIFSLAMQRGLTPAWDRIARRMHRHQVIIAPFRTGNLIANLKNNAYNMGVRSNSKAIDPRNGFNYARIQHEGGYASGWYGPHTIRGKFYMTLPLMASQEYIDEELTMEIERIIARCGLR